MSWRWQQLVRARFTLVLVVFLSFVHLVITRLDNPDHAYLLYGLTRQNLLHGQLWKLITYAFLHGNLTHLTTNVVMLLLLGSRLEWILGTRKLVKIFFFSALLGGLFHALLVPGDAPLVGPSAAAMGFLLCFCTIDPYAKVIPLQLHAGKLGMGVFLSSFIFTIIHPDLGIPILSALGNALVKLAGASIFSVGHACHLGGCVAGFALAKWYLRLRYSKESLQRQRVRHTNQQK
jgi:membrane associated rhomboid family serine protease